MNEPVTNPRPEHVGPRYVFLGTFEHDCLAGLPPVAPERSWPVVDAFPKQEFAGTFEHDCLAGLPPDAPERSWPATAWGSGGGESAEGPVLVLGLTLRPESDPQRTGNVVAQLLHALSPYEGAIGADKLQAVIRTILGFLRSKVPSNMLGQFDSAVGLQAADLSAEPGKVMKVAEKAGLSAGQIKSVFETVLGFLKDKLPADLTKDLSGQLTGLLITGLPSSGGIFKKVASLFTGK